MFVYQGGGPELPKNGAEWHAIRQGALPDLPQMSPDFNNLLKVWLSSTNLWLKYFLFIIHFEVQRQISGKIEIMCETKKVAPIRLSLFEFISKSPNLKPHFGTCMEEGQLRNF